MSKYVKVIATLLGVLLLIAAVTGVAFWTAGYDPDAPDPALYIEGRRVQQPGPVISVGSNTVPFNIYRHYYLLYKSYFTSYYGETWLDDPDGDKIYTLKGMVESELLGMYAWLQIAAENNIVLSEEELAEIDATLQEQKATHGAGWERYLDAEMFFMSEADYLEITRMQQLSTKANTEYSEILKAQYGEELGSEADEDYRENMVTAKHILIMASAETADAEQAKEEALLRAEEILEQIQQSEDRAATFDELMNQYSEDGGLAENPDGYTFKQGDMVDIFYETALSLEEGEVSQPVWSETEGYSGYHIILRLPLNEEGLAANRETAITTGVNARITESVEAIQETLAIVPGEYYGQLTITSIR